MADDTVDDGGEDQDDDQTPQRVDRQQTLGFSIFHNLFLPGNNL